MQDRATFWHSGVPDCADAMVSWIDGGKRPLLGIHGTGFFVRRDNRVAFVTSRHCLGAPGADYDEVVRHLAIPYHGFKRPARGLLTPRDWVRFDAYAIPTADPGSDAFFLDGDLDIAILRVSVADARTEKRLRSRAAKLPPKGDWFAESFAILGNNRPGDAIVLGFPREGTATSVDYDNGGVMVQGARYQGRFGGPGNFPHTWRVKFPGSAAPDRTLDGVSGGPVFLQWRNEYGVMSALAGMMIRGVFPDGQFIDVSWLAKSLRELGI